MTLRILAAACLVAWALWLAGPRPAAAPPPALDADTPPRVATLLAFHAAQDAGDVARMLLAATRLESFGEPDLAAHARHAARAVAEEAGTRRLSEHHEPGTVGQCSEERPRGGGASAIPPGGASGGSSETPPRCPRRR
jgi:hypothetical protein